MMPLVATALALSIVCQSPPADRGAAERLAQSGRNAEALGVFEQLVAQSPGDLEARLWVARLQLRIGRAEEAEAGFRSVLAGHPSHVDARIGLGSALTRKGAWNEALVVLLDAEKHAGANSDLSGALARAYRRAGDDRRALDYYRQARALAPADPDLVDGFEATAHAFGHSIAFEAFGEGGANEARSGAVAVAVRVLPRLRLDGEIRVQDRAASSDALAGGGARWRASRSTHLGVGALIGPGNTFLPTADVTAAVVNFSGGFEVGASIRGLSFADADVIAVSPRLAWDTGGRWRFDGRYTYSRSAFDASGEASGDHSVSIRETWRAWRRVGIDLAYAYGIESFEDLTADRLRSLDATTFAAGLRFRLPSLTVVATTWEHQWRSNAARLDRLTLSLVQTFP